LTATETSPTWARPWIVAWTFSRRDSIHFTGLFKRIEIQPARASSA
jgi:hypothetical protein